MEFTEVHVPQARNVPLDELTPGLLQLPKDQPVYLVCKSGQRATKAAEKLAQEGFLQPIVIAGGIQSWIDADFPAAHNGAGTISLERQVRIAAGTLVFVGVVLGWFVQRGFYGLSAFVGAGLVFAGITDYCGMGLLLAKMPWNRRK